VPTLPGSQSSGQRARLCPLEQQRTLALVLRQAGGPFEFGLRFRVPAQLRQQVAAHAGQQVVGAQRGHVQQGVGEGQARLRTIRHAQRDGAVQFHDGGGHQLGQCIVQGGDAGPVRRFRRQRPRVAGGDGGLQRIRPEGTEAAGALQRREAAADQQPVPARAVLVHQQDGRAVRSRAGALA